MNEQLQEAVTTLINGAMETAKTAGDFMVGEVPDVIQQLLMWRIAENGIKAFTCLIFIIGFIYIGHKVKNTLIITNPDKASYNRIPPFLPLGFCYVISSAILLEGFVDYLLDIVQIYIAPKVYLLEYASTLIK